MVQQVPNACVHACMHRSSGLDYCICLCAETLVHSSFRPISNADFVLTVEVDGNPMNVYVIKRPWLDLFLQQASRIFEVVVFTASLQKYADAVLDRVDPFRTVSWRLYRDSCIMHDGAYVKDLARMGRPLERIILVDNSAHSFSFHPTNGLHSATFLENRDDTGLLDIMAVLMRVRDAPDVRPALQPSCSACGYSPKLYD
jgi:carboxy-terminal domain RNA polymerase II polypeptide A small phosphatase